MIAASRRSILTGLVALVVAPAIVRAGSLMAVNSGLVPGVSMRKIVKYAPEACGRMDVLYGKSQMRPEWAVEVERIRDPAVIMEDARRMYSFNSEADRERFYANWMADHAFVVGEQWDKDRNTGLLRYNKTRRSIDVMPQIPDSLALAAAAVAIAPAVLAKPVTRRFWAK